MADGGYDVRDYCDIDPRFGTLADADGLIADAHALGLRVIVDLVANHTSSEHPWFTAALAAGPGSPERRRYFFRDGRAGGDEPPNDWISAFGGGAWTRVREPDGRPGQWYLHTFAPEQPDLDWDDPGVREEFDAVLRFWLDRGVDGLRVDAAPAMAKVAGLPDAGHLPGARFESRTWVDSPHWDVEGVHDILRRWRAIGDTYPGDRLFVTEAVVASPERLSRYVRPDEMHTSFNFDYLTAPWEAPRLRAVIDGSIAALGRVGAPATWVLSSHDETRHVTRFGRAYTGAGFGGAAVPASPADLALGLRRARAAALLTLALPGSAYLYQGEELGLPEVEDLPEDSAPGPHLGTLGTHRPGPGRVPGAAALERGPAAVRVHRRRRDTVAAAAAGLVGAHGGSPAGRSGLDALAVPVRPPPAAHPARPAHRAARVAGVARGGPRLRPRDVVQLRREPLGPSGRAGRRGAARQRSLRLGSAARHRGVAGAARRGLIRRLSSSARRAVPAGRTEESVLSEQPEPGESPPAAARRPRTRLLLALAAAVVVVDVVTKLIVVATIAPGEDIRVLGGLLYLTQLRNVGAAFSFAEGATVVFSLVAVAVAVVIVRTARRLYSTGWAVTLGLVLGGALGNLIDRIFRDPGFLRGGVVDFLSVFGPDGEHFPVFNVADSAITCGGILGVLLALRGIEFDGTRSKDRESADAG